MIGMTTSTSGTTAHRAEMIVMSSGVRIVDPMPFPKANGMSAKLAIKEITRIALKR
jgi:hypothetical protein